MKYMISYTCQPGEIYSTYMYIPKLYTIGKYVLLKGVYYKQMSKYHKRCSICDLSSNSSQNYNHPMYLSAPSDASYQQSLLATNFFRDTATGDTLCSHCLGWHQELHDTYEMDDILLDEAFDE